MLSVLSFCFYQVDCEVLFDLDLMNLQIMFMDSSDWSRWNWYWWCKINVYFELLWLSNMRGIWLAKISKLELSLSASPKGDKMVLFTCYVTLFSGYCYPLLPIVTQKLPNQSVFHTKNYLCHSLMNPCCRS